jgi:hypothetical protein
MHIWVSILGLAVIGGSALLYFSLHSKLRAAGYASYGVALPISLWFVIPRDYLKLAGTRGWTKVPAYVAPICVAVGIALVVVGLLR